MSEPVSGTAVATASIWGLPLAAFFAGVDYTVVVAAFMGSMFFVVRSSRFGKWERFIYFFISFTAGLISAKLTGHWIAHRFDYTDGSLAPLGAFLVSALAVTALTSLDKRVSNPLFFKGGQNDK